MGALPIVERLRRKRALLHDGDRLESVLTLTNPDGPEAAELIAELYEALDRMIHKFGGAQNPPLSPGQSAALQSARDALAKARGDQ